MIATSSGGSVWRLPHQAVVLGVLLISLATGWWSRLPELNTGGDDATYLSLSESLRQGRYNDEFLVGTPPHGKYPPGTPLWIATIRGVTGPGLDGVRVGNLLLLGLTAVLIGDAVRRLGGAWLGVGAAAVVAFNPTMLRLAIQIYSEIPYLALASLAVWGALIADERRRKRWLLLASSAALAAFLTRSIGVAVVAGIMAWMLLGRRSGAAWRFALASALIGGAWFAWTWHVGQTTSGLTYAQDLRSLGGGAEGPVRALLSRGWHNLVGYGTQISLSSLGVPLTKTTVLDNVAWLLLLVPAGIAGFVGMARRWSAAAITAALTAGILVVWNDQNDRLLSPLIPAALAAILLGWSALAARFAPRLGAAGVALLPVALAGFGLSSYITHDPWHRCDRHDPYTDTGCFEVRSRELVAAARFVRDSLPRELAVATTEPAPVSYFSGHQSIGIRALLRSEAEDSTRPEPATVFLLTRVESFSDRRELEYALRHCRAMTLRKAISPTTLLLLPVGEIPPPREACDALDRFAREPAISAH